MGRPWVISDEMRELLWSRYMCGESALGLSRECGVTDDALRKALRVEAWKRGYGKGLRLDEIRKGGVRRSRNDDGRSAFGDCKSCGRALAGHMRCKRCTVLLHGVNAEYTCGCGVQHGVEGGSGLCMECVV